MTSQLELASLNLGRKVFADVKLGEIFRCDVTNYRKLDDNRAGIEVDRHVFMVEPFEPLTFVGGAR